MAAEGEEVAVHRLYVYLEVGCALRSVYQDGNVVSVGDLNNVGNIVHRT